MTTFDRKQLLLVERLVDPERVLGPRTAAALRSGKKLEIPTLSFRGDLVPALFSLATKP